MKNWGWKNWLMFGIVMALIVTAGTMVAVFVAIEPDPTVLQVCWQSDGSAQYVGGGWEDEGMPEDQWACATPEGLVWPQGDALRVGIVDYDNQRLNGLGDEDVIVDGLDVVNDALDTNLVFVPEGPVDITFAFRVAYEMGDDTDMDAITRSNDNGGWCLHTRENGRLRASGAIRPAGNTRVEYRRAMHEMGHCLGLAHSRTGLMREGDLDDSGRDRMEPDRFSDGQQALMRQVYP